MKNQLRIGIVIIMFILTVGFASITTDMVINSEARLGMSSGNFDVFFSNIDVQDHGLLDNAKIDSATQRTIVYDSTYEYEYRQSVQLTYRVLNTSTLYDARCTVQVTFDDGIEEYFTTSQTGFLKNTPKIVSAQSENSGAVYLEAKKDTIEPVHIHFTVTLTVEPVSREAEAARNNDGVLTVHFDGQEFNGTYLPGYDNNGQNAKEYILIDVYTKYNNSDVELVKYDESSPGYYEYVGSEGNKYTFKLHLANIPASPPNNEVYKEYDTIVRLRDKNNPDVVYDERDYYILIFYNSPNSFSADDDYNRYPYQQGTRPWPTWFNTKYY